MLQTTTAVWCNSNDVVRCNKSILQKVSAQCEQTVPDSWEVNHFNEGHAGCTRLLCFHLVMSDHQGSVKCTHEHHAVQKQAVQTPLVKA